MSHSRSVSVHRLPARSVGVLAGLAVLLVLVASVVLGAGPALAHNTLQGTDPADGSTVDVPPSRVTLTFDEPAQALGTEMVVLGPDGSTVSTGDAELVDTTVSQALAADLPAGMYTVQWRVTSADGHPLSGALTFTAANGTSPADEPAQDPSADEASAAAPSADATTAAPSPMDDPTASVVAEDEEAGLAAGVMVAIVVGVLALAALVGFVVHERRKSKRA